MLFKEFTKLGFGEYSKKKITLFNYEDEKPTKFQIPKMPMPFGISGFVPDVGPIKYNVEFTLCNCKEEGTYINKFYTFLKKIEKDVIDHVYENRVAIFNCDKSMDEIKLMFNSNIKDKNDGMDPKFRVKVDTVADRNEIRPTIYDEKSNILENPASRGLYSRHSGIAIIELNSIYFMNKMFGCTWKLCEMKVFEPKNIVKDVSSTSPPLEGFAFRDA